MPGVKTSATGGGRYGMGGRVILEIALPGREGGRRRWGREGQRENDPEHRIPNRRILHVNSRNPGPVRPFASTRIPIVIVDRRSPSWYECAGTLWGVSRIVVPDEEVSNGSRAILDVHSAAHRLSSDLSPADLLRSRFRLGNPIARQAVEESNERHAQFTVGSGSACRVRVPHPLRSRGCGRVSSRAEGSPHPFFQPSRASSARLRRLNHQCSGAPSPPGVGDGLRLRWCCLGRF